MSRYVIYISIQVTVSSGGMLVTTLDPNDLNFEHLRSFDGTTVYAQNKVLIVMASELPTSMLRVP